jgi:hypothetical protein
MSKVKNALVKSVCCATENTFAPSFSCAAHFGNSVTIWDCLGPVWPSLAQSGPVLAQFGPVWSQPQNVESWAGPHANFCGQPENISYKITDLYAACDAVCVTAYVCHGSCKQPAKWLTKLSARYIGSTSRPTVNLTVHILFALRFLTQQSQ